VVLASRRASEQHRILGQVTSPDGFVQCGAQRSVGVMHRRWTGAWAQPRWFAEHSDVEAFDVLGPQGAQFVFAEARDQVHIHRDPIASQGVDLHEGRCDVLKPVRQPGLDRPVRTDIAQRARVPLPLEFTDLADDNVLLLVLDVTAVGASVVSDADRDATVPRSVLAEVDRRFAVGAFGHQATWCCRGLRSEST
jgi:hypothetical protein